MRSVRRDAQIAKAEAPVFASSAGPAQSGEAASAMAVKHRHFILTALIFAMGALAAGPSGGDPAEPGFYRAANGPTCMAAFYRNKDVTCLDAIIKSLSNVPRNSPNIEGWQANPALLGFFADLFANDAAERARILALDVPPQAKPLFVEALYEAGLETEAETYGNANGFPFAVQSMQGKGAVLLKQIKPIADAYENDVLIGAYMASGNTGYIKSILGNFLSASDGMIRDSLRIAMMHTKFGPAIRPPGRENVMMPAACQKYECKKDLHGLMRVLTLSSAFWAMQSLSRQDEAIEATFSGFFENDARLKRLLAVESNGFANYLTALASYAAIKDDANVNASLSVYEKLGSARDAIAAMTGKKN